jgi:hypothetical protein
MAVSLNHGVLRSIRLDAQNAGPTDLVVPLGPEILREDNQLVISVVQFKSEDGTEAEWTLVSSVSSLSIPFERRSVERSLADLPEPILKRRTFEPRRLTVLLPSQPSYATLEATARTLASLTARVAPAPVSLAFARALREVETPAVAVGMPSEQPELRDLRAPGEGATEGSSSAGILALYREAGPWAQPLLAVTGREPGALGKAALGMFSAPGRKGTRLLLVASAPAPQPAGRREWRRFIPPANTFTVDEVGDPRAQLAVTADLPARVRIKVPPDARFLPYGHRATLAFDVLPALASDAKAHLEVYWNDLLLRLLPMEHKAGARSFTLSAPIRASALKSENVLTVAWNGRSGATGPFVSLRGDSSLFLPREYVADLPDLAFLRHGFYPFSLRPDLAETVVGVPEDEQLFPALCELAALLGRLLPADQFLLRVVPASQALSSRSQDVILLEVGDAPSPLPLPDLKRLPRGESLRRLPLVQELEHSAEEGRYVLRLRAATPALLRVAIRSLGDPAVLQALSGDTAFLAAEGPLVFSVGARRRIAEISYLTRLGAWLREHWLALPLILAAASGLLGMGLRVVLGHYRSQRLLDRPAGSSAARAT